MPINSAAELHDYLLELKALDLLPDGRDRSFYASIKEKFDLPAGEFKKALERKSISAQDYLRALIESAKPFAEMYREIWNYCKSAGFLQSQSGVEVYWVKEEGKDIKFDFEAFRKYERLLGMPYAPISPAQRIACKNTFMDWLASLRDQPRGNGPRAWRWLDIKPLELFNQYMVQNPGEANLFGGFKNVLNGSHSSTSVIFDKRTLETHSDYQKITDLIEDTFFPRDISDIATDFITLPLWKFRWQVYELWIVAIAVQSSTSVGFVTKYSQSATSQLELGKTCVLASRDNENLIYQPNYQNRDDQNIRPDIVLSNSSFPSAEFASLIIECKQRKVLARDHINEVMEKYRKGVNSANGAVVMVNYDQDPGSETGKTGELLLCNVAPGSIEKDLFISSLLGTLLAKSNRREVWYVDMSASMACCLSEAHTFKNFLVLRAMGSSAAQSDGCSVFTFAKDIELATRAGLNKIVDLTNNPNDDFYEGRGVDSLCKHLENQRSDIETTVYVVTDLSESYIERISAAAAARSNLKLIFGSPQECFELAQQAVLV